MKRLTFILFTGIILTAVSSCELFPPFPGNGGDDPKESFLYVATNCPNAEIEKFDADGNTLCTEEDGADPVALSFLYLRCAPEELRPNPCPPVPPTQIPNAFLPISQFQILVHTPDPSMTSAQIVNANGTSFAASSEKLISFDPDFQFAIINFEVLNKNLLEDDLFMVVKTAYINGQQNISTLEMTSALKSGAFTLD